MNKRKIAVITSSRSDYGLLYWLIKEIHDDTDIELQLIVSGTHLSPEFGLTYKIIEEDGFFISKKIEMLLSSDTPVGIAKTMGLSTIGFAEAFDELKPDVIVLLGDRYELLPAAQAAMVAMIPVAHIHGGEATEGVIDEAVRHSLTKLSQLHFVAAEPYRKRVIQLGENPKRVFNVGALGLDNIVKLKLLNRADFEKSIDFKLGKTNFLVTYHPVTLKKKGQLNTLKELINALNKFPEAKIVFTQANSDTGGREIFKFLSKYVSTKGDRAKVFISLGQLRYLSALKHVSAVIGNSSSGILEAPYFQKPTINIGLRQLGRIRASSVIDCDENSGSIENAIKKGLSHEFQEILHFMKTQRGDGNISKRIKEILKTVNLNGILMKRFYDIPVEPLSC